MRHGSKSKNTNKSINFPFGDKSDKGDVMKDSANCGEFRGRTVE